MLYQQQILLTVGERQKATGAGPIIRRRPQSIPRLLIGVVNVVRKERLESKSW